MKRIIISILIVVFFISNIYAKTDESNDKASALDTIKSIKENKVQQKSEIVEDAIQEFEEQKEKDKNVIQESIEEEIKQDSLPDPAQNIKDTIKNGKTVSFEDMGEGINKVTNKAQGFVSGIAKFIISFFAGIKAFITTIYAIVNSIGEAGLFLIWISCITLAFIVPKKWIVIRKLGLKTFWFAAVYTVIFFVGRIIVN